MKLLVLFSCNSNGPLIQACGIMNSQWPRMSEKVPKGVTGASQLGNTLISPLEMLDKPPVLRGLSLRAQTRIGSCISISKTSVFSLFTYLPYRGFTGAEADVRAASFSDGNSFSQWQKRGTDVSFLPWREPKDNKSSIFPLESYRGLGIEFDTEHGTLEAKELESFFCF